MAWAPIAWYREACAANCAAVSADTSSAAAGTTPVVGAAAAILPAAISEPIPCRSPAAKASISGCVVTNDMCSSYAEADPPGGGRGYRGAWVRLHVYTDDAPELVEYIPIGML